MLICSGLMAGPVTAQINIDAYRDYFLVGQFGEVCTMCEVIVVCAEGDELPADTALPEQGDFMVYHLQTRTFWSQIATIWEWFISNFAAEGLAARGHTRPVHVYAVADGNWSNMQVIEGRLILEPALLEFGDYNINRIDRRWQSAATGADAGYCARVPLWESLDAIAANAPGGEP